MKYNDIVMSTLVSMVLIVALMGALRFVSTEVSTQSPTVLVELFDHVFDLTEQLLHSYECDAIACKTLSLQPNDPLPAFTDDMVLRLTLAIHELNRQRQEGNYSAKEDLEARLTRMAQIVSQSIAHAKRDLCLMASAGKRMDSGLKTLLEGQIGAKKALLTECQKYA